MTHANISAQQPAKEDMLQQRTLSHTSVSTPTASKFKFHSFPTFASHTWASFFSEKVRIFRRRSWAQSRRKLADCKREASTSPGTAAVALMMLSVCKTEYIHIQGCIPMPTFFSPSPAKSTCVQWHADKLDRVRELEPTMPTADNFSRLHSC